jgi:hypothetical protein
MYYYNSHNSPHLPQPHFAHTRIAFFGKKSLFLLTMISIYIAHCHRTPSAIACPVPSHAWCHHAPGAVARPLAAIAHPLADITCPLTGNTPLAGTARPRWHCAPLCWHRAPPSLAPAPPSLAPCAPLADIAHPLELGGQVARR